MPDNQPSNAPQATAPTPTDDLTAAAVLRDDTAGPGAHRGPSGQIGAETQNTPATVPVPRGGGDGKAEAEARVEAATSVSEPGHTTQ